MAERSRRTGINQDRVLQELAKLAFVKITDVIDMENAKIKSGAKEEDLCLHPGGQNQAERMGHGKGSKAATRSRHWSFWENIWECLRIT